MFWMVQQLTSSMGLIKNTPAPHIGPIGTDGHKLANNTETETYFSLNICRG